MHHLIFDFDGVLGNTIEVSAYATGIVDGTDTETGRKVNAIYARNKPNHARGHTLTDTEMHKIFEWTSAFGKLVHEKGFPLFLEFIHEIEEIPTEHKAVVSSGSQHYVIPAIEKTQINPTHILAFENHHSKEEKIELICKDWGISVMDVFYFTDTLADIFELRDMLNVEKLIGVSWGYCSYDELAQELDEAYILKAPKDIHNVLKHA